MVYDCVDSVKVFLVDVDRDMVTTIRPDREEGGKHNGDD